MNILVWHDKAKSLVMGTTVTLNSFLVTEGSVCDASGGDKDMILLSTLPMRSGLVETEFNADIVAEFFIVKGFSLCSEKDGTNEMITKCQYNNTKY